jgi:FtsH-binding integral membrane protein
MDSFNTSTYPIPNLEFFSNLDHKSHKLKIMTGLIKKDYFKNNGKSTISDRSFYLSISLFISLGLLTTWTATLFAPATFGLPFLIFIGFVIPMIGVFVSQSDSFPTSLLGYSMITIPFGLILKPVLDAYSPDVVNNAVLLTAMITTLMGTSGLLYPNFYSKIGTTLFISLCCLLFVRILGLFIPELRFGIIDWIAAGIFSLYIGYDMYRASVATKSIISALHISVSLYLDIINLFLNILKIIGDRK